MSRTFARVIAPSRQNWCSGEIIPPFSSPPNTAPRSYITRATIGAPTFVYRTVPPAARTTSSRQRDELTGVTTSPPRRATMSFATSARLRSPNTNSPRAPPDRRAAALTLARGAPVRGPALLPEIPALDPFLLRSGELHPERVDNLDAVELRGVVTRCDDHAPGKLARVNDVLEPGRGEDARVHDIVPRREDAGDDRVPQHRPARPGVPRDGDGTGFEDGAEGLSNSEGEVHGHVLADDAPDPVRSEEAGDHTILSRMTRRPFRTRAPSPTIEASTVAPGPTELSSPMMEPVTTAPASTLAPSRSPESATVAVSTVHRGPSTTLGPRRPETSHPSGTRTAPSMRA